MRPVSHQELDKCSQQEWDWGWDREPAMVAMWGFGDAFASELGSDLGTASMLEHFSLLLFLKLKLKKKNPKCLWVF